MTDDNDRERGILSPADRRFLRGESDLAEGTEYNTRRRIRERFSNALLDLRIIHQHMTESDREQALDDVYGEINDDEDLRGMETFAVVASVAYEAAERYELPFEVLSNHAIRAAMRRRHGRSMRISVESDHTIRLEQPGDRKAQLSTIKETLAAGGDPKELNPGDQAALFQQLLNREDIDPADLAIEEWNAFLEDAFSRQQESDNDE